MLHVPSCIFDFMFSFYLMGMHSDWSFVIPLNHLRFKLFPSIKPQMPLGCCGQYLSSLQTI